MYISTWIDIPMPMFVASLGCAIWALYLLFTRPAKLPTEPLLD